MTRLTYRQVAAADMIDVERHLLRLSPDCRKLRFGNTVNDHFIQAYVAKSDLQSCTFIGGYEAGRLVALVEVRSMTPSWNTAAELAFSVERDGRGQRAGSDLMCQALAFMRSLGLVHAHVVCDRGNLPMRKLLQRHGAVEDVDGCECFARIDVGATGFAAAA